MQDINFNQYKEIALDRVRLAARRTFDGHSLAMMRLDWMDAGMNQLVATLSTDVIKEDLGKVTRSISYPDGWWQMFKRQYFPGWLQKYFPIKLHTSTWIIEKMGLYPKLPEVFDTPNPIIKYKITEPTGGD